MQDESTTPSKACRDCGQAKPLDGFYRRATSKDGRSNLCTDCSKRYAAERRKADPDYYQRYYAENRARIVAQRKEYRVQHPEVIADQLRRSRAKNADKVRETTRRYIARNRVRISERRRLYLQRPEVQARSREYVIQWRRENKERWLSRQRAWEQNNPEKVRAVRLVHNHKKRASEGTFTAAEWDALCARYGRRCLSCGSPDKITLDHVVPICKGGTNWISNLQPLCSPCNIRKRCKIIDYRPIEQQQLF